MENLFDVQVWLSKNPSKVNAHAGKWIAVSGAGVVASAGSLGALTKKLSQEQKNELLLTRIPTKKEATGLVLL